MDSAWLSSQYLCQTDAQYQEYHVSFILQVSQINWPTKIQMQSYSSNKSAIIPVTIIVSTIKPFTANWLMHIWNSFTKRNFDLISTYSSIRRVKHKSRSISYVIGHGFTLTAKSMYENFQLLWSSDPFYCLLLWLRSMLTQSAVCLSQFSLAHYTSFLLPLHLLIHHLIVVFMK